MPKLKIDLPPPFPLPLTYLPEYHQSHRFQKNSVVNDKNVQNHRNGSRSSWTT